MPKVALPDYERWRLANLPNPFSLLDYVHGVVSANDLAADIIIAIAQLVWPHFIEVDGVVYLAEQYSEARLSELTSNGRADAEYWMNLVSVDGLLHELKGGSAEYALSLAELLSRSWAAKLSQEFPQRVFDVRVQADATVGDVCVVFTEQH
jgi:hypothetical protein